MHLSEFVFLLHWCNDVIVAWKQFLYAQEQPRLSGVGTIVSLHNEGTCTCVTHRVCLWPIASCRSTQAQLAVRYTWPFSVKNNVVVAPPEQRAPLLVLSDEEDSRRAALGAAAAQRPVRQGCSPTELPVPERLQTAGDRRQVPALTARIQRGGLRGCTWSLEPGGGAQGQLCRDRWDRKNIRGGQNNRDRAQDTIRCSVALFKLILNNQFQS